MNATKKREILTELFKSVMRCHTCGNYIDMSDIEGLTDPNILWDIDLNEYNLVAYTEFGMFKYKYNFDLDFDENLNAFVENLREHLSCLY